jgi:hypothetical protein
VLRRLKEVGGLLRAAEAQFEEAMRRRDWLSAKRRVFSVAAALCVVACGCSARETDKAEYIEANRLILESLPRYPRTKLLQVQSTPYYEEDGPLAEPIGYTTRAIYRLPNKTTGRQVGRFYERRLRRQWTMVDTLRGPHGAYVVTFRRGDTTLSVNADNAPYGKFEIAADHDYYDER